MYICRFVAIFISSILFLLGCESKLEIDIPPCLTKEEGKRFVALKKREKKVIEKLNSGDNSPEIWRESYDIAPKIGYLINASNIRNTLSGCRYDWY
jgi:hypothetical protein